MTFFIETGEKVPYLKKRQSQDSGASKLKCNLCNKKRVSTMMRCVKCEQWQHCSCAGYVYREAVRMEANFQCKKCK